MDELINNVNELIRLEKGDLGRLTHIKDTLQHNKTLYESDKEYLEKLSRQYLNDKLNVDETHYNQPNPNSFCSKCGQNLKSGSSFCPKCGFSILSSTSKKENHNINSKDEKIERPQKKDTPLEIPREIIEREESIVTAIAVSIIGIIVILFGIGITVYSLSMPMIFAGQYMILGLFVIVIGGLIMYGGKKLIKKKKSHFVCGYCKFIAETERELYNHSLLCEKKKSEDSLLQEKQQTESFCEKCGNKIYGNNSCMNCNQSTNSPTKHERKERSKGKMVGIAFGVIIFIFFMLAISS